MVLHIHESRTTPMEECVQSEEKWRLINGW